MKIIVPQAVTPSTLTSSNVPETDAPAWSAGTYYLGDQVIYNHRVWEVIATSTTDQPDTGAVANPPTWLDTGADNRYKMFDRVISTQTENDDTIEVTITPGTIVNAVALFGLSANQVTVVVDDPTDGIVYDTTKNLQDNTLVTNWYSYFFEPIIARDDVIFDDLPSYGTAAIEVIVDAGAGTAKCAELVIGQQRTLGVSNFGTGVSIIDYSIKSTDEFGNVIIVPRAYSKRADYDVTVETSQVSAVQKSLADIRTTPTVFIGDSNRPETVVYGYYKQFQIVLSTPSISSCSLEVEGLV